MLRIASLQSRLPSAFLGHGGAGPHLQAKAVQFFYTMVPIQFAHLPPDIDFSRVLVSEYLTVMSPSSLPSCYPYNGVKPVSLLKVSDLSM